MTTLRILHLYPVELGINGDVGNVLTLRRRAEWRGIEVEVVNHDIGSTPPASVDLVHIGSGPVAGQAAVRADLAAITPRLAEWKAAGVPFLAIAGGWQLLGTSLTTPSGKVLEGAGLFASTAVLGDRRVVGEVVVESTLGRVAGFENHSAVTAIHGIPLGSVTAGTGNGDGREGLIEGSSIATNLHGPFLPMNPAWADVLLRAALRVESLPDASQLAALDAAAAASRIAIAGRLGV